MKAWRSVAVLIAAGILAGCAGARGAPDGGAPDPDDANRTYRVYVANESSDIVNVVRFGPDGATVEKAIEVGMMPGDLDGAHGLSVAADGSHWYLTTAHGTPWGRLWKYETGTDVVVDSTQLGLFPATIGLTANGTEAYVVNFNLHGDPEPSSVSVVSTGPTVAEVARIETCVQPHGSRVTPDGSRMYSVCVADDMLVEIDTEGPRLARMMSVRPGAERVVSGGAPTTGTAAAGRGEDACKPTWAEPGVDGDHVYVACNGKSEVLEIATGDLRVTRRLETGQSPYNLEATADGRYLLATNKGAESVSVVEIESGEEAARIPSSRSLPHGVVTTPDSRFAFISNEAVGATRGTVDVIDLGSLERVDSVEVEHQAGGIDFWKMEPEGGGLE